MRLTPGFQFCSVPNVKMGVCKWPQKEIKYYENMKMSEMSRDAVASAYDLAFKQWADVAGIKPIRVDSPSKANIVANLGWIDIPGMTLAWSYLPCGATPTSQFTQKYDSAERWTYNYLVAVACHELGHALGLSHTGSGTLMAPVISNITKPTPIDIKNIQALYGPSLNDGGVVDPVIPPVEQIKLDKIPHTVIVTEKEKRFIFSFSVPFTGFLGWGKTGIKVEIVDSASIKPVNCITNIIKDNSVYATSTSGLLSASLYGGTYSLVTTFPANFNGFAEIRAWRL